MKFGPGFDSGCRQGQTFHFFSIWWCGGVSIDKKIIVDHLERGYCGGGQKFIIYPCKGPITYVRSFWRPLQSVWSWGRFPGWVGSNKKIFFLDSFYFLVLGSVW